MSPRSVNTIARTLIQTVVRQKLNAIKSDPERSLRNLVDMGLSFAVGGEQKRFLQQAQHALQDENSAYYRIIYDMALHVDTEHLMGFGMNLGYNSLTAGARTIRRLESECGYDIPWCLTHANEYSKINAMYGGCNYKAVNWETSEEAYTTVQYEQFAKAFDAAIQG